MADQVAEALISLKHGLSFPYDHPNDWDGREHLPSKDWAHDAARGVIADLTDRRGIKRGFEQIDEVVRVEIVERLAEIIRLAHASEAVK